MLICFGLAGIAFNGVLAVANSASWDVDFNQYYAAAKLVGSGDLYNWDAIRSLQRQRNETAVPFGRLPAFAYAFKPLSALPYSLARVLWLCAGVGALAGLVALGQPAGRAWACVAICWSNPAAMCLAFGQDSVLFVFFAALGLWLLRRGRDFCAGLLLSVCAAKPHLAVLLPVLLAAKLKWRALLGGLAGGVAIVSVSFAVEGKQWPNRLFSLARLPEFDPAANRMPNLRGLLSSLDGGLPAEIALALVAIITFWFLFRRQPLHVGGNLSLAGGLLLSHHAYVYDALLLLPALMLPYESPSPKWLRSWALLLLTPVPYLFLLTDMELYGHLAISGYTLALTAATAAMQLGQTTSCQSR